MVKEQVLSFYLHFIVAAGNVKDGWRTNACMEDKFTF